MSGGQQQRVGLARALAPGPAVMLLDEPFASVDATLRRELRERTRRALRTSGAIAIVVTHDPVEALELGDQITYISGGRVRQSGSPDEIWRTPADQSVALAFGDAQSIAGQHTAAGIATQFGVVAVATDLPLEAAVSVVVRPEAIRVEPAATGAARVEDVRFSGPTYTVVVEVDGQRLRARQADLKRLTAGDTVNVVFDPQGVFVFPTGRER